VTFSEGLAVAQRTYEKLLRWSTKLGIPQLSKSRVEAAWRRCL